MNSVDRKFESAVEQGFSYLVGLGFVGPVDCLRGLEYLSDKVIFNVAWDPLGGELSAFMGLTRWDQSRGLLSVYDMFRTLGLPPGSWAPPQVCDPSRIDFFVHGLAIDICENLRPALLGDRIFFRRVDVARSAVARKHMKRMELEAARSAAEVAWRAGDFSVVVSAYEKMESHLARAEVMRLIYAKRKVGDEPDSS